MLLRNKGHYRAALVAIFCTISFALSAKLQRLVIMPQKNISISKNSKGSFSSMCIDYYRDEPYSWSLNGQPAYDQIYSTGKAVIKIDGKVVNTTIEELVAGKHPILLAKPTSSEEVVLSINPVHPLAIGIGKIEIEVQEPAYIGNIKDDRDVSQAQTIFKQFGTQVNQTDFWNAARIFDVLKGNNLLQLDQKGRLTQATYNRYLSLKKQGNITILDWKQYRELAIAGCIKINQSGQANLLKPKETESLYYNYCLKMASKVAPSTENTNSSNFYMSLKEKFYTVHSKRLNQLSEEKGAKVKDIYGKPHILMSAIKNKSFISYFKNENGLIYYETEKNIFGDFPLFLTEATEMAEWCQKNILHGMIEKGAQYRMMQGLGLPPGSTNDTYVEFWVPLDALFRPGIDSSLKSRLQFSDIDSIYLKSLFAFTERSYKSNTKYPFTGMCETFDWFSYSEDHRGLSEFVARGNVRVILNRELPFADYINEIKK